MNLGDVHIHINEGQQSSRGSVQPRSTASASRRGPSKKRLPGPKVVKLPSKAAPFPAVSRPVASRTQAIPVVPSASIASRNATPRAKTAPTVSRAPATSIAKPRKKKRRGFLKKAGRFIKKATIASLAPTATTAIVAKKAISSGKKRRTSAALSTPRPSNATALAPISKPRRKKRRGFLKKAGRFMKKATIASLSPTATTAFAAKKIVNSRKRRR